MPNATAPPIGARQTCKLIAVVASNRQKNLQEFLRAWSPPPWDATIIIEDGPQRSFDLSVVQQHCTYHFSWAEIAIDSDVIEPSPFSSRDSAIKMYGFWSALRLQADVIIVLDDDCHPFGPAEDFTAKHVAALSPRPRWVESVDGSPTRGIPYFNLGVTEGAVANMGVWRENADYDSPQTLALQRLGYLDSSYNPWRINRLMHPENFWPWSAMNIAFRREVAPLLYMPKMGERSPYARFDDIWCGIVLQRCCRHLGLSLAVGEPHVRHLRASNPLINLEKEAPGIRANEVFWTIVEGTTFNATRHTTPLACAEAVATHLAWAGQHDPALGENSTLAEYLVEEGSRMQSWCKMFRNHGWK
jgi:hypothetical protein